MDRRVQQRREDVGSRIQLRWGLCMRHAVSFCCMSRSFPLRAIESKRPPPLMRLHFLLLLLLLLLLPLGIAARHPPRHSVRPSVEVVSECFPIDHGVGWSGGEVAQRHQERATVEMMPRGTGRRSAQLWAYTSLRLVHVLKTKLEWNPLTPVFAIFCRTLSKSGEPLGALTTTCLSSHETFSTSRPVHIYASCGENYEMNIHSLHGDCLLSLSLFASLTFHL